MEPTPERLAIVEATIKELVRVVCLRCRDGEEITYDSEGCLCHGIDPRNGCGLELCAAAPIWIALSPTWIHPDDPVGDFLRRLPALTNGTP